MLQCHHMEHTHDLSALRHTLAHVLAQAVLEYYPAAQLTLGPAVDNGFYYDIDFGTEKVTDEDLKRFQTSMRKNLKNWTEFTHKTVSIDEAKQVFEGNSYKIELIEEIAGRGEEITLYTSGGFTDLCRGGHCEHPNTDIPTDCFKLDRIAGAYWRGDEKNKMLTRVYGLAFETSEKLDEYIHRQEEAVKRDHRKLGKELKLFTLSEHVGSGLPLFQPKGLILRQEITDYLWDLHKNKGYQWVWTPHLAKESLYEISGHAGHYLDDMFRVHGGTSKEDFFLKPMNCPHHYQLFADNQFSYRDMPVRYFEPATIYRDEKTGQLSGLTRVRSITQDDGHLFCRPSQIKDECIKIVEIIKNFYTTMGMMDGYWVRLSVRDDEPNKWLGTDEVWKTAEEALTDVCESLQLNYKLGAGEAAFYGPKLDFMFKDAIGREWQLATVQCDFNAPERFEMSYVNEQGNKERPVVIHRAIAGSLERFIGVAIEHFAGAFPVWMSPIQIAILPVSDEHHSDYAQEVYETLKSKNIRVQLLTDDSLGKRIRSAKTNKIPYQIIIGDKERDSQTLTVEGRNDTKIENISVADFIAKIEKEISERILN